MFSFVCLFLIFIHCFGHVWVTLCFIFAVWSVAHTTLAVPWPAVPGTVCPLTPPRCTPSPRWAAQGQSRGPALRPVDRHTHNPVASSQRAWRQLMVMMKPTALRDLPTYQSVGECVRDKKRKVSRVHEWAHQKMRTSQKHLIYVLDSIFHNLHFSNIAGLNNSPFHTALCQMKTKKPESELD